MINKIKQKIHYLLFGRYYKITFYGYGFLGNHQTYAVFEIQAKSEEEAYKIAFDKFYSKLKIIKGRGLNVYWECEEIDFIKEHAIKAALYHWKSNELIKGV